MLDRIRDADTSRKIGGFDTDGSGNILESTLWDLRTEDATLVASATTATEGKIEIATDAEAEAGTETDKALVPSNLASILQ